MKKVILSVAALFMLAIGVVSCNNETLSESPQATADNFDNDLANYVAKQKAIMNEGRTRAAAGDTLSSAELEAMAAKLDSTQQAFYRSHSTLVGRMRVTVSADEFDVMRVDADSLLTFVGKNYCKEVYDIVYRNLDKNGCIEKKKYSLASSAGTTIKTDVDKTLIANSELSSEFGNLVVSNGKDKFSYTDKKAYCKKQYDKRKANCTLSCIAGYALDGLGVAVATPTTVLGWTFACTSFVATYKAYVDCCDDAYQSYLDCLK